jgi:hypothetical protein
MLYACMHVQQRPQQLLRCNTHGVSLSLCDRAVLGRSCDAFLQQAYSPQLSHVQMCIHTPVAIAAAQSLVALLKLPERLVFNSLYFTCCCCCRQAGASADAAALV